MVLKSTRIIRRYFCNTHRLQTRMASTTDLTARLQKLGISDFPAYPKAQPDLNPVDIFRSYISDELSKISGVDRDLIFPALEYTSNPERGDMVIPVPRLRVKGAKPDVLAKEWADKFPANKYVDSVTANGMFLQFTYSAKLLFNIVINDILTLKTDFGRSDVGKGQTVVVEFSSPNIAKPFHAGHLRSTIIGGFLSNLHEKHGYKVERINYLGDWGKQFGLLAVGFERYGSREKLQSDPINHLFEIYVKVNQEKDNELATNDGKSETDDLARQYFRKMEDGDEKYLTLWQELRDMSIEKYKATYKRLNIEYDSYSGESQVPKEKIARVMKELKEKNLVTEDKGALLVDFAKYNKKLGKTLVQKSDGTTLYLTRDVGEAIKRYETYKFDKMIYVIGSQQDLHTAQFFKIIELMGYEWASKLQHVNFGMIKGMSTRKGTVVFLSTIIEETKDAMHEVMKKNEVKYAQVEDPDKVADLVGLSAIMVQDMQSKRNLNYEFDWSRMLSFEGDTGPYLQYAHSRLRSMERNANFTEEELLNANWDLLTEPIAATLIRTLASWPDVTSTALKNLEPSTILTYLFKMTHIVSSCYDVLWVMGQERELAIARMALYSAARQVLYNGLVLLGITPVDRM